MAVLTFSSDSFLAFSSSSSLSLAIFLSLASFSFFSRSFFSSSDSSDSSSLAVLLSLASFSFVSVGSGSSSISEIASITIPSCSGFSEESMAMSALVTFALSRVFLVASPTKAGSPESCASFGEAAPSATNRALPSLVNFMFSLVYHGLESAATTSLPARPDSTNARWLPRISVMIPS